MVVKTRLFAALINRGEHLDNAAWRRQVIKSIEKAQEEHHYNCTAGVASDITNEEILNDVSKLIVPTNPGGWKKGTTNRVIRENMQYLEGLVTLLAILYDDKIKEAKKAGLSYVPNGTLKKNANNEEDNKAGLSVITISLDTIRSRVKRCNLTAYSKNL